MTAPLALMAPTSHEISAIMDAGLHPGDYITLPLTGAADEARGIWQATNDRGERVFVFSFVATMPVAALKHSKVSGASGRPAHGPLDGMTSVAVRLCIPRTQVTAAGWSLVSVLERQHRLAVVAVAKLTDWMPWYVDGAAPDPHADPDGWLLRWDMGPSMSVAAWVTSKRGSRFGSLFDPFGMPITQLSELEGAGADPLRFRERCARALANWRDSTLADVMEAPEHAPALHQADLRR